jgi:hypothetical protein
VFCPFGAFYPIYLAGLCRLELLRSIGRDYYSWQQLCTLRPACVTTCQSLSVPVTCMSSLVCFFSNSPRSSAVLNQRKNTRRYISVIIHPPIIYLASLYIFTPSPNGTHRYIVYFQRCCILITYDITLVRDSRTSSSCCRYSCTSSNKH